MPDRHDAAAPLFRFAPSPNGYLHLGHAYSALFNAVLARRIGGKALLRIEDIDLARCRPHFERAAKDDLAWVRLHWPKPVRRQSEHFDDYRAAADRLRSQDLLYPCFCSRNDIAAAVAEQERRSGCQATRDPDGSPLYPGTCRKLDAASRARRSGAGEPHAWRIAQTPTLAGVGPALTYRRFAPATFCETRVGANPGRWGDAVIVRKDTPTSYHLSVVVDDAVQGITHVVRGRDLEAASDLHALLQERLGLPRPAYYHHGLVTDEQGDKLAKRRASPSIASLRESGLKAQEVIAMLMDRLDAEIEGATPQ